MKTDDHPIVRVLFPIGNDTIRARMLRALAIAGNMTQADFMREYLSRCERATPSRSSFSNTFGLYVGNVSRCAWHHVYFCPEERCRLAREGATRTVSGTRTVIIPLPDGKTKQGAPSPRMRLHWVGPHVDTIVRCLSDGELGRAFASMERSMCAPRASDGDDDLSAWVVRLRNEIARREAGGMRGEIGETLFDTRAIPGPYVMRFSHLGVRVTYHGETLAELSMLWDRWISDRGLGASGSPHPVTITNANAPDRSWRVSYNGRIWDVGGALVYDPAKQRREALDEARWEARHS